MFFLLTITRGRERRNPEIIVQEVKELFENGYREVTLGQNVDSYRWNLSRKDEIVNPEEDTVNFAQLLIKVVHPDMRVRFILLIQKT